MNDDEVEELCASSTRFVDVEGKKERLRNRGKLTWAWVWGAIKACEPPCRPHELKLKILAWGSIVVVYELHQSNFCAVVSCGSLTNLALPLLLQRTSR